MFASDESSLLATLAERVGIASEYYDIGGTLHVASDDAKRAILSAMGFNIHSTEELTKALREWEEAPWRRPCEPVLVVREGTGEAVVLCCLMLEDGKERSVVVQWTISDENGQPVRTGEAGPGLSAAEVRFVEGQRRVRLDCRLPGDLPIGYYTVTVQASGLVGDSSGTMRLIVAPQQCYLPPALADHRRIWGMALQLYALSSNRNWGCGDFTDLGTVVEWAGASLGAGLVGLNPLHALRNSAPHHTSPYAPVTRLFLNELYIDLERLPEFWASPEAQRQFQAPEFQAKLKALRESRRVDYDVIATAKRGFLDLAYRQFLKEHYVGNEPDLEPKTARAKLLERFIRAEGESLELYATFQTLEEERRLIQPKASSWRDWPAQFQSPGPAVREYGKRHRKRLRFFQYIQWVASEQLGENRRRSEQAGMTIGLYNDLALGAERFGAESWMYQSVLALDADCGAPPDSLGPQGQNWGLPPVNPLALRAGGYELIIRLLRNNLRFGGAIRLDHVMALCRLFWIPRGKPAAEGTYVHYPFEDLLAIVALESVRAKTLVIGEDLGTVPDWVREELAKARVLSYRVFYFERHGDGTCKAPNEYPEQSLAVVGTHDLPTLTGFWSGEDLQVRAGLGALGDDDAKRRAWEDRRRDKGRMLEALARESLLPEGLSTDPDSAPSMTPALCQAIHIYLARTTSAVVLANLEDGLEELSQTNLPGTIDAHPNWNRKYAVPVETLPTDHRLRDLAAVLRSARPLG
ncbi:MAG: 4-alpha-glucanotransferase [Nitrospira sp.]